MSIIGFQEFLQEAKADDSADMKRQHDFVQSYLANNDINSTLLDNKTLRVDKADVNLAKNHLKNIGHENLYSVRESVEDINEASAFKCCVSPSWSSNLEGNIQPIPNAKMSKLPGFDATEDKDGYSKTHMVTCNKTGACHTAYTKNGELRIRPYGKVPAFVSADLVKHLLPGVGIEKPARE